MKKPDVEPTRNLFTDFDGRFKARLANVRAKQMQLVQASGFTTTARYECQVRAEYNRDLMRLVEEGMLLAIRNFKSNAGQAERYTLTEIASVRPEHYGMRGLSSESYYPMQFEIIQQSVKDWESDDKSTMMIHIDAIPINFDLVIPNGSKDPQYLKGFSYPVIAEQAFVLNAATIHQLYNKRILEEMKRDWRSLKTTEDARKDARLGTIKMFESAEEKIPLYVDFESLVRYHFGVFSFTGAGKTFLLSNIIRRLLYHTPKTKIVIFDISMEYPFLLLDVFGDKQLPSKILLDDPVDSADTLFRSIVKPREFEKDEKAVSGLEAVLKQGKVARYVRPRFRVPTYADVIREIDDQSKESAGKQTYIDALEHVKQSIYEYMEAHGVGDNASIDADFVKHLDAVANEAVNKYKVSDKSNVYAWCTTRSSLLDAIRRGREAQSGEGFTRERILDLLEGPERLLCFSIADPLTIKELAIDLTREVLWRRKRAFRVEPWVLFVFDEAQEFVPQLGEARGIERQSTEAVETLLRQGRKYGLGCCIATQRIAYLNTNALQQLHTYFVSTLPRPYDRQLVSQTFTIDPSILEKTLEFSPGDWLISSYIATGMENVPIFFRSDNPIGEIRSYLEAAHLV